MHGIGHRWQAWEPVIDLLAAERDVIAVDLPGFGASPPLPPGMPYDLGTVVTVLGEFLDKLGLDRPHVAGNSLGGLFALEAADRGLARSVTALSPAGFFTPMELRYAADGAARLRLGAGVPGDHALAGAFAAAPRPHVRDDLRPAGPDDVETLLGDAAAMRGAVGFVPTLRAGRGITFGGKVQDVPATIAWGTRDRLLRAEPGRTRAAGAAERAVRVAARLRARADGRRSRTGGQGPLGGKFGLSLPFGRTASDDGGVTRGQPDRMSDRTSAAGTPDRPIGWRLGSAPCGAGRAARQRRRGPAAVHAGPGRLAAAGIGTHASPITPGLPQNHHEQDRGDDAHRRVHGQRQADPVAVRCAGSGRRGRGSARWRSRT